MSIFHQCGDPVAEAAACLCQHHGAAYVSRFATVTPAVVNSDKDVIAPGAIIAQQAITITERCCVVVNAATVAYWGPAASTLEIERPLGTIRTTQEDLIINGDMYTYHHAAWETLDAGTYTYYLVNRHTSNIYLFAAWLKIIASDCEG